MSLTESTVEEAALDWFGELDAATIFRIKEGPAAHTHEREKTLRLPLPERAEPGWRCFAEYGLNAFFCGEELPMCWRWSH